ncbi:MAG TPA: dihydrofolate reductase family protein [Rugosimonospora sp.]|nr:dihydrofolate reductase family protein [Rugosimonospora sp.]
MRKIINSTSVSLDGIIDNPGRWSLPYFGDDSAAYATELNVASDALLMGRRTYEGFAASWPNMEETEGEFAVRMNAMPKYVVSTTLEKAEWNNTTIIRDNVVEAVTRLKAEPGNTILLYGFGPLSYTLLDHGLLDEVHFWIHPVLLGAEHRPEGAGDVLLRQGARANLELVKTTVLASGVVVATYRPATG